MSDDLETALAGIREIIRRFLPDAPKNRVASVTVHPMVWRDVTEEYRYDVAPPSLGAVRFGGLQVHQDPGLPVWAMLAADSSGKVIGYCTAGAGWSWDEQDVERFMAGLMAMRPAATRTGERGDGDG